MKCVNLKEIISYNVSFPFGKALKLPWQSQTILLNLKAKFCNKHLSKCKLWNNLNLILSKLLLCYVYLKKEVVSLTDFDFFLTNKSKAGTFKCTSDPFWHTFFSLQARQDQINFPQLRCKASLMCLMYTPEDSSSLVQDFMLQGGRTYSFCVRPTPCTSDPIWNLFLWSCPKLLRCFLQNVSIRMSFTDINLSISYTFQLQP